MLPTPPSPARPRWHLGAARPARGCKEAGGGTHRRLLLTSPAAGIYLAGEPALPGPAPTSTALPAAAGDKGEGLLSGALAPQPSAAPAAAATPLQLPQRLALEAAILAPAPRPPSPRSRRRARHRHGMQSADTLPHTNTTTTPSSPRPAPACLAGSRSGAAGRMRRAGAV